MTLLWPFGLVLLTILPILPLIYLWMLRRRRRFALRYSSLSLVRDAAENTSLYRRHIPPGLFFLSLTALIMAMTRPVGIATVPALAGTVILSIDVSRSMMSDDIAPTRLDAAKEAAHTFIQQQPGDVRIGVVAFSGFAAIVQEPTDDKAAAIAAVNRLHIGSSTAIGEGLLTAMKALHPEVDLMDMLGLPGPAWPRRLPQANLAPAPLTDPGVIVLLSDGRNRSGILPLLVAPQAKALGIRVYTVGVGTHVGSPGPGGGRGMGALDEDTLRQIADITGGEYYSAQTAGDLSEVYQNLGRNVSVRTERTELTAYITGLAALLAMASGLLSLLWFRMP